MTSKLGRTSFFALAGAITSREIKQRGALDGTLFECGDNNFERISFVLGTVGGVSDAITAAARTVTDLLPRVRLYVKTLYPAHIATTIAAIWAEHDSHPVGDHEEDDDERPAEQCYHSPYFMLCDMVRNHTDDWHDDKLYSKSILPADRSGIVAKTFSKLIVPRERATALLTKAQCAGCADMNTFAEAVMQLQNLLQDKGDSTADAARALADCLVRFRMLLGHRVRCAVQTHAVHRLQDDVVHRTNHVHIILDFKMKWLPVSPRESQGDWFGKRGISWHGSCVIVSNEMLEGRVAPPSGAAATRTYDSTYLFFDDVIIGEDKQDATAVLVIFDALMERLVKMLPVTESVTVQSDNAGCYSSATTLLLAEVLASNHGLALLRWLNNEAGDGKTVLDAHFGVMSAAVFVKVDAGADASTALTLADALAAIKVRNTSVATLSPHADTTGRALKQLAASCTKAVPGVRSIRDAEYTKDAIVFRMCSLPDVGDGEVLKPPRCVLPRTHSVFNKLAAFNLKDKGSLSRCVCRVVIGDEESSSELLVACSSGTRCGGWFHPKCFELEEEKYVDKDDVTCPLCENPALTLSSAVLRTTVQVCAEFADLQTSRRWRSSPMESPSTTTTTDEDLLEVVDDLGGGVVRRGIRVDVSPLPLAMYQCSRCFLPVTLAGLNGHTCRMSMSKPTLTGAAVAAASDSVLFKQSSDLIKQQSEAQRGQLQLAVQPFKPSTVLKFGCGRRQQLPSTLCSAAAAALETMFEDSEVDGRGKTSAKAAMEMLEALVEDGKPLFNPLTLPSEDAVKRWIAGWVKKTTTNMKKRLPEPADPDDSDPPSPPTKKVKKVKKVKARVPSRQDAAATAAAAAGAGARAGASAGAGAGAAAAAGRLHEWHDPYAHQYQTYSEDRGARRAQRRSEG